MYKLFLAIVHAILCLAAITFGDETERPNFRKPKTDDELKHWMQNMVWHHRFTVDEIREATGLTPVEIDEAIHRFDLREETKPTRPDDSPLLVLPYPGGRHPRIGFLNGAIRPQRETKISVFTPWDPSSYVVVDVPEALWSNLGLTYLAHTHIPTLWSKQGIELPQLEWNQLQNGVLEIERTLPNQISFQTRIIPAKEGIRMTISLTNGTSELLSDLRVQNCVMLKGAKGFDQQTKDNKLMQSPYVACHNPEGDRWIITAWQPIHRPWANPPCPCLHADPKFPDCSPGETQRIFGWLSFYEGTDIQSELKRLDGLNWDQILK